jgi:hypothetical protein
MKATETYLILCQMDAGRITLQEAHELILRLFDVVGRSEQLVCDVCGSNDVIEAPHMGKNCNRCHPL